MTNYYKILGVKKDSSQEEIKNAYKTLIKKYHPDLYQGDKLYAEKKTKEINVAYETLANPSSREAYDLELFPPTPSYNYDSSSSDNYSYTPPKYDQPPSDYYTKYKNQYSNPSREYNYNDFANYHADKRYTNYHRSKTPSSNYVDQNVEDVPTKMMHIFDRFSANKKVFAILGVMLIYGILFFTTVSNFSGYMTGENTGPLLNEDKPAYQVNTVTNTVETDTVEIMPYEDFDINDYLTDTELYTLYQSRYKDQFSTFEQFKTYLSQYLYTSLIENY